jgi:biotin transport system substrate-specific component
MHNSPHTLFVLRHVISVVMGVGIMIVASHLSVDMGPVPFTFQNAGVHLIAMMLPPGRAFLSVLVWLALGMMGLPLFALFYSGAERIIGPTGGYFLGMLIAAPVMSACQFYWYPVLNGQSAFRRLGSNVPMGQNGLNTAALFMVGVMGSAIILVFGFLYLGYFYCGYPLAFEKGVYPFLIPSVAKIILTSVVISRFKWSKIGQ